MFWHTLYFLELHRAEIKYKPNSALIYQRLVPRPRVKHSTTEPLCYTPCWHIQRGYRSSCLSLRPYFCMREEKALAILRMRGLVWAFPDRRCDICKCQLVVHIYHIRVHTSRQKWLMIIIFSIAVFIIIIALLFIRPGGMFGGGINSNGMNMVNMANNSGPVVVG